MEKITFSKKKLYRDFGISEWDEKSTVLTELEIEKIYDDLRSEVNSPLVSLIKLPFPQFIELYLSRYRDEKRKFESDPALGYKLFMLTKAQLKKYVKRAKIEDKHLLNNDEIKDLRLIDQILKEDFATLIKPTSASMNNNRNLKQLFKLMPYIDLKTAFMLGINTSFFESDGVDGYDFEEKMNCLNRCARYIMIKYLGLYGEDQESSYTLSKNLKTQTPYVKKILDLLMQLFQKPIGEFKYALGYIEKDYGVDETREYTNTSYRDFDLNLELLFIKCFMLNDQDKAIMDTLSRSQERIYLAAKYLYDTKEQVARNLVVSLPNTSDKIFFKK